MKLGRISFFLFFILFTHTIVFAQSIVNKQLKFRFLTVENGLYNNRTTAIVKCKKGYMWIGTDDGINRFDGLNNKYYQIFSGNRENDKWNQQISDLYTDLEGNFWIGAYTLFYYDYESDEIKPFFKPDDKSQPIRIRSITEWQHGKLWVGARKGLYLVDTKTQTINLFQPQSKINGNLEIYDISVNNNKIWLVTEENGLFVFNIDNKDFTPIEIKNEKNEDIHNLLCVYADNAGKIWIGSRDDGLYSYNSLNKKILKEKMYPETSRIRKIQPDSEGNLWFGTVDGLYLKPKNSGTINRKAHEDDAISILSQNSIHNIYIDNHEIMWLCSFAGGICYTDMHQKQFTHFIPGKTNKFINSKYIASFTEDKNGVLYVGTDSSGINIFDKRTGLFSYIPMGKGYIEGKNIRALAFDSKNMLWIGTYQGGVIKYDPVNKTFKLFSNKGEKGYKLQSNSAYSIAIDKYDNIWVGTNKGIDRINNKTETVDDVYNDNGIHYVYIDKSGNIWDGVSDDGVFKYDSQTGTFKPFCPEYNMVSVTTLYCDSRNNLWVGEKSGLVLINLNDSAFKKFTINDGLPNNTIQAIMEDNKGNLWLTTAAGLSKFEGAINNPLNIIFKNYTIDDGLQGEHFTKNAAFKSRSGFMYIGGRNGFNQFHPDSIYDDQHIPSLDFGKLEISNTEISVNQIFNGNVLINKVLSDGGELNLSYKYKSIFIELLALHYGNPLNVTYAYMLYPLEKEWKYSKPPRNFVSYYSIPEGKYYLRLKAANSDGIWNNNVIELKINIIPPFWKQKWILISGTLLFVFLILFLFQLRIKSIENQKIKLESLVNERTSEIQQKNIVLESQQEKILEQKNELSQQKDDLEALNSMKDKLLSIIAHDLKNPFNSVLGFTDLLLLKYKELSDEKKIKYVELINRASKKIYNLLDNLLYWSRARINLVPFNPEKANIYDIVQNNIKLLEVEHWKKNITITNHIPEKSLITVDKDMINVVVRNLLSNAIKFSNLDGNISIGQEIGEKMVTIHFIDNGVGISEENVSKLFEIGNSYKNTGTAGEEGSGLGLLMCKEFIEKHGGKISVNSKFGEGSDFYFTLPLHSY